MELTSPLTSILDSLRNLIPEGILVLLILWVLILGLINIKKFLIYKFLIGVGYCLTGVILIANWPNHPQELFNGMLQFDDFSHYFKLLFLVGGLITVLISRPHPHSSEYFLLQVAIVLGSFLLAMSLNFVMVILSLELISLSSYLLAGFGDHSKSAEGSLKYFLFGTVATAIMIYGISVLYGLTGTLQFSSNQFVDTLISNQPALFIMAAIMVTVGLLFKVSAVPLHIWTPDVYESAPTPIVAFFSVVPKLAGFAALIRLVLAFHLFGQSGYPWPEIIGLIALFSIIIGNVSALTQTNPKRMLAYSSVAQSGFMLIGVTSLTLEGIHYTLFYASIFLIMNFLVFSVLNDYEDHGVNEIPAFSGLGRISWFPAVALLVGMVALTGLPPTAGFTGKLLIFGSLWTTYQVSGSGLLLVLFVAGLINTVVSLFFYLKIPYFLFLKEAPADFTQKSSWGLNLFHLLLVLLLIYLFLQPAVLMGWINRITFVL